eukprot:3014024-Rhodomonas_salina.3
MRVGQLLSCMCSCMVMLSFGSPLLCTDESAGAAVFRMQLRRLRGGADVPHLNLLGDWEERRVDDNVTLRTIFSGGGHQHVAIAAGTYCWDWRAISPWFKRVSDEHEEFPLMPLAGSVLRVRGEPSRLDGQWDFHPQVSGSFSNVEFGHASKMIDGRQMMLVNGGPWRFERCQLRSA